jgi:hypothetical protein
MNELCPARMSRSWWREGPRAGVFNVETEYTNSALRWLSVGPGVGGIVLSVGGGPTSRHPVMPMMPMMIGLTADEARELAAALLQHAESLDGG